MARTWVTYIVFGLIVLTMSFIAPQAHAAKSGKTMQRIVSSSPYSLVSQIANTGSTELSYPEVYLKRGIWAEDRFIFPGAPEDTEVLIGTALIDDTPIDVIQLQLRTAMLRSLKFSQIPPRKSLILYLRMPPVKQEGQVMVSSYVRVYLGNRLLDRVRITPDADWVRKKYPFESAQFLKQKLELTLKISSDTDAAELMLFGYVEK